MRLLEGGEGVVVVRANSGGRGSGAGTGERAGAAGAYRSLALNAR